MHDQGARGFSKSLTEIETERERELLAALDQVENDLLDRFEVRPISAQRAIEALRPFIPAVRHD